MANAITTLPLGDRRGSNPRPPGPQPGALPTELRPPYITDTKYSIKCFVLATGNSLPTNAIKPKLKPCDA